jgi:predicted dehydrogenase
MKFLVIGLGSMGKRRIRNLKHLRLGDVAGFDLRDDRRQEAEARYGIKTYADLNEALEEWSPQAVVVSTPPDKHLTIARLVLERGKHVFCEIGTTTEGMRAVIDLAAERSRVAFASCTMRFQPSIKKMKSLIDSGAIGKILAYTHHCGQYLPDWHKDEDYRTFYVSRRETGACREMVPFELTWLNWLVGARVDRVTGMQGKVSDLDCDIDDVYHLLLRYENQALCHLMIDVVARAAVRSTRVLGTTGTLEWSGSGKLLRHYAAAEGTWTDYPEPKPVVEPGYNEISAEGMYIEEMAAYAAACRGESPNPNSFVDELDVLETLMAAESAFSTRSQIERMAP